MDEKTAKVGAIFNIQRFSVNDGPGIRTTVFLQGCPLKCPWCHNPESQEIAREGNAGYKFYTAEEVLDIVLRDRTFYETSGGGITLSGGEPLFQAAFSLEILKAAKEAGLHTCVETTGCVSPETLTEIAAYTDLFLYDYKATDEEQHKALIGISREVIMRNLELLNDLGKTVILRCPLIPEVNVLREEKIAVSGINVLQEEKTAVSEINVLQEERNTVLEREIVSETGSEVHLQAISALTHRFSGIREVQIEPYHSFGEHKYREMGREVPPYRVPSDEEVNEWIRVIRENAACEVKRA